MRIWNRITGDPWAITETSLHAILEIAKRENESPQAVAAKLGRDLQNSYNATIRDNVAVIPVTGPLFRYANIFTSISGASSYELIARDFIASIENPEVKAILLDIDSPGGEVNGVSELASMIYEARGTKPIIAYASGDAASGAYWIASAADEIVMSETSALGSIGVVGIYSGKDKESGEVEIISSQSPYKRLDPTTDDGKAKLQSRIDAMAEVFIENIARNRGTGTEDVKNRFGKGDVFIGKQAVTAGLADRIGSFEKLITELSIQSTNQKENEHMDIETLVSEHPDLLAQAKAMGAEEEKSRLKDILGSEHAKGRETLAREMAITTSIHAVEAIALLSSSPKEEAKPVTSFEKLMANIPNPEIEPEQGEMEENIDAVAKRIATA